MWINGFLGRLIIFWIFSASCTCVKYMALAHVLPTWIFNRFRIAAFDPKRIIEFWLVSALSVSGAGRTMAKDKAPAYVLTIWICHWSGNPTFKEKRIRLPPLSLFLAFFEELGGGNQVLAGSGNPQSSASRAMVKVKAVT